MPGLTQEDKFITIDTPLGEDAFFLYSMSGEDHISRPFRFHLELLAEDPDISPTDLIGKAIDIKILLGDGSDHFLNGHVESLQAKGIHQNGYRQYQAEIIPWFSLLRYIDDCRIFQAMDVKAIVEEVFNSRGYSDFEFKLQNTYRSREYTVQYRESDFNFVSRLLEEEGIFYFHTHEQGKHILVIADDAADYITCTEANLRYFTAGRSDDHLSIWNHQYSLVSGKCSQDDYNFKTPATDISVNVSTILDIIDADKFERYDYPGLYADRGEGDGRIKARIEEQETQYEIVESAGTYRSLQAGGKFKLELHEIASEKDKEYVITNLSFLAQDHSYDPAMGGGRDFDNRFQCIPAATTYRPVRNTIKPTVQGPQTAVVVGPSGEEIYTDEFGRIKVQFHWDRVGEKNENSSCWLRVGQQMAGKQWGAQFIPRIGHEVIVSFLEGDPDQPLVTGCVYNADNKPPYDLPANKTQSGWKTRSSTGGGAANYNEIRFEDKKGSESVTIHAEKDQSNTVENDETTNVGNNRTESVGNDEAITIGNNQTIDIGTNRTENVGSDESVTIGSNRTETVGSNENITIGSNRTENVGSNETITIGVNKAETVGVAKELSIGAAYQVSVGAAMNETIGGAKAEEIGAVKSVNVGANSSENIGKDKSVSAGKKISYTCGDDYSLKGGKKGVIDIKDELTIKVGKAAISMKKDGTIAIKGKDISLNAKGEITIKAKKNVTIKGKKVLAN